MTSPLETKAQAAAEHLLASISIHGHAVAGYSQAKADAIAKLLLAFASEVERETLEGAAKALESEAYEIQVCAESYHHKEPGNPRETLMREANHYRRAAQRIRSLSEPPAETPEPKG